MTENQEIDPILPEGLAKVDEPVGEKPVDPALMEKIEVLKRLTQIDSLLTNCLFPGGAAADILGAKQFLQKLHTPILAECELHPDYARVIKPREAAPTSSDYQAAARAAEKRNRKARRASN